MQASWGEDAQLTQRRPARRLALCGNVFPGETPCAVASVLEGPVCAWAEELRRRGHEQPLGFGLYFAARAAAQIVRHQDKRARLVQALSRSGVETWTANAFPFGGFHDRRVKEAAFLPDWTRPQRLLYTCQVAEILCHLLLPGSRGSLSTCPLGYGPQARRDPRSAEQLRRAQERLLDLEWRSGVRLILALEPEPDGAFERVADLAEWLAGAVLHDCDAAQRRVGVCWDLCHSAVVGEEPQAVAAALAGAGVPLGKVQISAALQVVGGAGGAVAARLAPLARDPYLHQVRGVLRDGRPFACRDLCELLDSPAELEEVESMRIHCHVPVHRRDYGDGLLATDWRAGLAAALAAGCGDFELETYTLPVLPPQYLEASGVIGTMVAETEACAAALGLGRGAAA